MRNAFLKISACLLLAGALAAGCKKKDKPDLDQNTTADNANAQSLFDDVLRVAEDVLSQNNKARIQGQPAATINCATVDTSKITSDSIIFTVTFGGGSCTDPYDGKVRSGKLLITLKGASLNTPGAKLTIKSLGYTVNGVKVDGMKRVTCMDDSLHAIIVSDTINGKGYAAINYTDGKMAQWKSYRSRKLVSAGGVGLHDNTYDITTTAGIGNPVAQGINREGRYYVVNIQSPLRLDFSCVYDGNFRYPTQGILELVPDGKGSRRIDYGSGACDNDAKVTIGSYSYDVKLTY